MSADSEPAGLEPIFLRVAPTDIALIKFLFESYEGVAVVRTVDRRAAVIVALVSRDRRDPTARRGGRGLAAAPAGGRVTAPE